MTYDNITPTIRAIPTVYKGTRFRSRLEARWAAFFDVAGWSWNYEPVDLQGWVPDFAIAGSQGAIYVEIKPVLCGVMSDEFDKAINSEICKTNDVLLLGLAPIVIDGNDIIGLCNDCDGTEFDFAQLIKPPGKKLGYCSWIQSYRDRISGYHDGTSGFGNVDGMIQPLWGWACNAVQWIPK